MHRHGSGVETEARRNSSAIAREGAESTRHECQTNQSEKERRTKEAAIAARRKEMKAAEWAASTLLAGRVADDAERMRKR